MVDTTRNSSVSVSTTSTEALSTYNVKRKMFAITNTSTTAVITIAKGDVAAVAGAGIRLQPNGTYFESNDQGFVCWQGAIQVVADASGTIGVTETIGD